MDLPDEEPDRLSNKLLRYDPSQDQWTERAPMKYSKYRFSTAVVNSEIYVLGGIGCVGRDRGQVRKCLDAVEIYNPDGDFWREGPPMPTPLLGLRSNSTSAGAVDGKLYVCGGFHGADRHEVICKEILELDPWENQWNVVAVDVLMHDSYDVCLVARMNPRDLIPPPSDLVEEPHMHMQIQCNPYQILFAEMEKFSLKFKMKMPEALNSQNYFFVCSLKRTKLEDSYFLISKLTTNLQYPKQCGADKKADI